MNERPFIDQAEHDGSPELFQSDKGKELVLNMARICDSLNELLPGTQALFTWHFLSILFTLERPSTGSAKHIMWLKYSELYTVILSPRIAYWIEIRHEQLSFRLHYMLYIIT